MVVGHMFRSTIVHIGRYLGAKEGYKLYEPICSRMMRGYRHPTYLLTLPAAEVTCKKCQAKATKYPHLFQK